MEHASTRANQAQSKHLISLPCVRGGGTAYAVTEGLSPKISLIFGLVTVLSGEKLFKMLDIYRFDIFSLHFQQIYDNLLTHNFFELPKESDYYG